MLATAGAAASTFVSLSSASEKLGKERAQRQHTHGQQVASCCSGPRPPGGPSDGSRPARGHGPRSRGVRGGRCRRSSVVCDTEQRGSGSEQVTAAVKPRFSAPLLGVTFVGSGCDGDRLGPWTVEGVTVTHVTV